MMNADFDPFTLAARKYKDFPGNPERVYRALCYVLSDRADQVDWEAFTADDWCILKPMAETEGVAPLVWWKLGHGMARATEWHGMARATEWHGMARATEWHGMARATEWHGIARNGTGDGMARNGTEGGMARNGTEGGRRATAASLPIPAGLLDSLAPAYYETLARNTLLLQELGRILEAFEQAGIEVIVLKGAALAQTLYEDIGLRPMSDIDLLVRPEDVWRVWKIICSLGYQSKVVGDELQCFKDGNILVELHWTVHWFYLSWRKDWLNWLWKHSQILSRCRHLAPSGSQVFLIGHLGNHYFLRELQLLWLYDIWQSTQRYGRLVQQLNVFPSMKIWTSCVMDVVDRCFGSGMIHGEHTQQANIALHWMSMRSKLAYLKASIFSGVLALSWRDRLWLSSLFVQRLWNFPRLHQPVES
ncbi:MAG: hypothetical protein Fur0018_07970 [Anaerolineales bacterium]